MKVLNKYKIPIIFSLITLTIFFGGISFAYFFVTRETNTKNIISTGDFNIEYESGNGINLTNTYPMPDGYGQKTKGHEVSITNSSKTKACYEIILVDKYTDTSESYQGNSTLIRNQLRYSINNLTPNNIPNTNEILYSGILNQEETKTINFRLWIDEKETIETAANKAYYGKLIINTVNCETPPESVTKGAPTITSDTNYVQTQTIKVLNDATFENGNVAYYEYVIKPTNTVPTESDIPNKLNGSSIQLTDEQIGFISFRGISTHNETSPWSNRVEIKVDKTAPVITIEPETGEKEDSKTIVFNFNDEKSGVSYYQVTNENKEPLNWIEITNANETSATFTATKNGTYYVWAKDKAGNINSTLFYIKNVDHPPIIVEHAAGYSHSLTLDNTGKLYAWGDNSGGQLGDGTWEDKLVPTLIATDIRFKSISAGRSHSLAIDIEGNLYAWGNNEARQLGDGTTETKLIPTLIKEGTKFKEISAGAGHSLAIDEESNLYAWGIKNIESAFYGEEGGFISIPTLIEEGIKFKSISAGEFHSLALNEEGKIYHWGVYGLDLGLSDQIDIPTKIDIDKKFVTISAGRLQNLAIDIDGNLYAWGIIEYPNNENFDIITLPSLILENIKFKSISTFFEHSLVIDIEGKLYAWGGGWYGQLGDGTNETRYNFSLVSSNTNFESISAGGMHSLAIDESGKLYAWGNNNYGQLGDGTNEATNTPISIFYDEIKFKMISPGGMHNIALDEEGNLYAWGNLYDSDGIWREKHRPTLIMPGISFKSISAGSDHSLAIDSEGNLYAWGANWHGKLGDGTTFPKHLPVNIMPGTKFQSIATGYYTSFAIDESNNLYAWGANSDGYLGDGTNEGKTIPTLIMMGTKFKEIDVGWDHILAIDINGNLYSWGKNYYGQLGDGTYDDKKTPSIIMAGTKFESISAGSSHNLALDIDGKLYTWGDNYYGQLGDGTTQNRNTPVQIMPGRQLNSIAAELSSSFAIDINGNLYGWGHFENIEGNSELNTPTNIMSGTKFLWLSSGIYDTLTMDENSNIIYINQMDRNIVG